MRTSDIHDPALAAIYAAFRKTVEDTRVDPDVEWHSGWIGNMQVNLRHKNNLGLCYQWKRLVYKGVLPTVKRVGWDATGIVVNKGTAYEHHAVVVFDPRRTQRQDLLKSPQTEPAYVLDAWRHGRADIYRLADWLKMPLFVEVPAKLMRVKTN